MIIVPSPLPPADLIPPPFGNVILPSASNVQLYAGDPFVVLNCAFTVTCCPNTVALPLLLSPNPPLTTTFPPSSVKFPLIYPWINKLPGSPIVIEGYVEEYPAGNFKTPSELNCHS